ncbi:amidohydrolase family protein [Bifidobacterium sp. CP2]|uniref:amidohydrolase family protein n=1 Tax=Bifidobacterium sp. CP2 TaxID=2809025 RepID=UPI001BDBEC11|nr:amidohydrolase family protein [Bifidobacterium sp. CP2]MBT1181374.1 amidohydrolase family protein [Bifidobacterium sp. CP2]
MTNDNTAQGKTTRAAASSAAPSHTQPDGRRVLNAARAFTGKAGQWIADASVAIDGARIAWVGPTAALPEPYRTWPQEHHPTSTLLPGFVETHAHLGTEWRRNPTQPNVIDPAAIAVPWNTLQSLHTAQRLADQGVTTVQSLGALDYTDVALREAVEHGLVRAPRIVAAGAIITPTGGHGWRNGSEVDSIPDIRRAVREHHKAGVDTIKFAGTGGFLSPGSAQWRPQFTLEELRAGVEEAHRLGKTVAVHAHGTAGIEQAVEAGADLIAHASFVSDDGFTRFVPELAERIAAAGIYVDVAAVSTYPLPEGGEPWFARSVDLYRHGVKVVAGHDLGIERFPPEAYLPALVKMHEAGLPAEEVLVAATARAAKAVGLAGVTGMLAAGYAADVVAVDGDPLADFTAVERVTKVLIRGVEHPLPSAAEREARRFSFWELRGNPTLDAYQERRARLAAATYE